MTNAERNQRQRERYANDPEYRERKKAASMRTWKARYATNPEVRKRAIEARCRWQKMHRDKYNAYMRAYMAKRRAEARAS